MFGTMPKLYSVALATLQKVTMADYTGVYKVVNPSVVSHYMENLPRRQVHSAAKEKEIEKNLFELITNK